MLIPALICAWRRYRKAVAIILTDNLAGYLETNGSLVLGNDF